MDLTMVLIAILSVAVIGFIVYIAPKINKLAKDNNVPVENILDSTEQVIGIVTAVVKQLDMNNEQKDIIGKVAMAAQLAVKYAEQLYKSGQIPKEERKQKAVEFVEDALKDAGIELTIERTKLIECVIESAVFLLPKTEQ